MLAQDSHLLHPPTKFVILGELATIPHISITHPRIYVARFPAPRCSTANRRADPFHPRWWPNATHPLQSPRALEHPNGGPPPICARRRQQVRCVTDGLRDSQGTFFRSSRVEGTIQLETRTFWHPSRPNVVWLVDGNSFKVDDGSRKGSLKSEYM